MQPHDSNTTHTTLPQPPKVNAENIYPSPSSSESSPMFGGVTLPPEEGSSSPAEGLPRNHSDEPIAVVKVLSVRGVEYAMMTLALWIAAAAAAWILLNLVNGNYGFSYLSVPSSSLIVCLPIFGFFFLRLKKGELADPSLRLDPSKRRWSQTTQLFSFLACVINFIVFIYAIMQNIGGSSTLSIGKAILNLLVVLVIAGGILAYYWFDEHRTPRG